MVHADKIHKWLSQPDTYAASDAPAVDLLVEKYPYFIPGRYLQVIQTGRKEAFTPAVLNRMHLFSGNWLLYYRMMQGEVVSAPTGLRRPEAIAGVPPAEPPVPQKATEGGVPDADNTVSQTEPLIAPVYTEDYFLHQGIRVPDEMPRETPAPVPEIQEDEDKDKSLMVVMSFSEWLSYFKEKTEKDRQEANGRKALKTMWQKEKLAAALEDETDEIPDDVFNMAVNSISREENLASESLADILVRQGKYDKAIEMYRTLSLRNPQKNAYFAARIEKIQKEKEL